MARTRWITRTVLSSKVKCAMFRPDTKTSFETSFMLPGDCTGIPVAKIKRELEKKADANLQFTYKDKDGNTYKATIADVEEVTIIEKLYWMEEDKFIQLATKVTDGRDGVPTDK